jgi:phosphohistidine phosphatase
MKLLGLLRHAKSDWNDMALRDYDRGLNKRGRRGAALMGSHIADHGIRWDHVIASPAVRVVDTLEASELARDVDWQERAYLANATTLIDLLRNVPNNPDNVLLAGHNPGLQELIFSLVPPEEENQLFDIAANKYPTAAYAVLELDIDDWSQLDEGCGKLVHMARPRDLDPELGPEVTG